MAESISLYSISRDPSDEISELFVVLSTLALNIVPLGIVNFSDLESAKQAVQTAFSVTSPTFASRYEALESQLQGLVTIGMVFCSECYPMHIYYGFGVGVYNDFEWATKCWQSGTCAELNRALSALKDERKEFWLLKKVPAGMDRIEPTKEKIIMKQRKTMVKAREDLAKRIEKKGFPQPLDKSFTINSWWIPFATWDSAFMLYNEGHSWERVVRWQADPGRLLYAFIVDRELNLRDGELLLAPAGPAESIVRWLEGLNGMAIKLISESDLDFKGLSLSSATRDTMHYLGRQDAYAIRDSRGALSTRTTHMPQHLPSHTASSLRSPQLHSMQSPPLRQPGTPDIAEMPGESSDADLLAANSNWQVSQPPPVYSQQQPHAQANEWAMPVPGTIATQKSPSVAAEAISMMLKPFEKKKSQILKM